MVDFPGALPPVGGPHYGGPIPDQMERAKQDAEAIGTGFDHIHDRLGELRHDPSQVDDGHFIGLFVDDLAYTQSALAKVEQDRSEGKITDDAAKAIAGDAGIAAAFYEIAKTPIAGIRLNDMMQNLDPPPMTDAAHYCQGLATGSRDWLEGTVLPGLKAMSEQLHNFQG